MKEVKIGVIGGSGIYDIEGVKDIDEMKIDTPFGSPSDNIIIGNLEGRRLAFLPRHGRGHRIFPHQINYRANIFALKKLGVERIISLSAVGSMREDIAPGDMVVVDQFYDRTKSRISTFFSEGLVVHVGFSDPVCPSLSRILYDKGKSLGLRIHMGGTYLCMEGPQFSTKGESLIYRKWGVDVIGMTNIPEAKLAREAEICFSTIALVTDYDCWHETEEPVSVDMVVKTLLKTGSEAKRLIKNALTDIPEERTCQCASALRNSILTEKKVVPAKLRKDLDILIGRYLEEG